MLNTANIYMAHRNRQYIPEHESILALKRQQRLTRSFGLNTTCIPAPRALDGSCLGLDGEARAVKRRDGKEDWPWAVEHFIARLQSCPGQ